MSQTVTSSEGEGRKGMVGVRPENFWEERYEYFLEKQLVNTLT